MSATSEMRHRRRQVLTRLAALRSDLDETLRTESLASDPSLDVGRTWAELLCLLPALGACMRDLNTALGKNGSLMALARELDQLGSELYRLRLLAIRSTGAGSSELKAASKAAVEALLACLTEWDQAAAQADRPPRLAVTYPSRPKPPGHSINDIAKSYLRRNDRRGDEGSRCCMTGLILAFTLGVSIGGD